MSSADTQVDFERTAFVIMPFGAGHDRVVHRARFEALIAPAVNAAGNLTCVRADDIEETGVITERVIQYLLKSKVVIADLYGLNPNVLYELGVRHAVSQGTILLAPDPKETSQPLPFNMNSLDIVFYSPNIGLEAGPRQRIEQRLRRCLHGDVVDSPVGDAEVRRAKTHLAGVREYVDGLAAAIAAALQSNAKWAATALEQAKLGAYAHTIFGERQSHFRAEKQLLASQFSRLLFRRCQRLLKSGWDKVYVVVDSGTTLVPVLEELAGLSAQAAATMAPEERQTIKRLVVVTNNLPGVQAMMEYGRVNPSSRFSDLAIDCHILPGVPLPVYSAVAGDETESALSALRERPGRCAFIGVMTGNWVRIRRGGTQSPVVLARGAEHIRFKQALVDQVLGNETEDRNGEVHVVAPLGKVFCPWSMDKVREALGVVKGADDTEAGDYEELTVSEWQAKRTKMVSTSRPRGYVLSVLSEKLSGRLAVVQPCNEEDFIAAEIGKTDHLLFDFDDLPPNWSQQIEVEFPHPRTRVQAFFEKFHTTEHRK